jgi:hypothetical protein
MNSFVTRENIRRYRDRLWSETDAKARARVRDLLLAEENHLAANLETLAFIEAHIADTRRRIELQRCRVNGTKDGHQHDLARTLLDVLIDTEICFKGFRERILGRLDRSRL